MSNKQNIGLFKTVFYPFVLPITCKFLLISSAFFQNLIFFQASLAPPRLLFSDLGLSGDWCSSPASKETSSS